MKPACLIALALAGAPLAASARTEGGSGSFPWANDHGVSVVEALHLPDLMAADGDVFRFSSSPALGGLGYAITITELPKGAARLEAVVAEGHPYRSWKRIGGGDRLLTAALYAAILQRLDGLYRLPAEAAPSGGGKDIVVCTDGPGYVAGRRKGKEMTWLEGFCRADHPNRAIARELRRIVANALADLFADNGGD